MSVSYQIMPDRSLVYVRYSGFIRLADTFAVFGAYARDPDRRPGQKQLVDLARVTGMEKDYTGLMKLQAEKAGTFMAEGQQTLLVYYAPSELAYRVAKLAIASWEPIRQVVPLIQQTETGALDLLGRRERSFAQLLERAV